MPIKPSGVDFKRDLRKLRQLSNDMRATMMKVKRDRGSILGEEQGLGSNMDEYGDRADSKQE